MFDQKGDEPNKSVKVMVALGPDNGRAGGGVLLFSLSAVTDLHAHLCAQPEEASDEVVGLQDALLVHLYKNNAGVNEVMQANSSLEKPSWGLETC